MSATRVVVADDSAFMRRLISDVLTRADMDVVATAANGREAIEACRAHKPDVLSLDLAMPEVDGLGVMRALRGMTEMRTVVVSSFSEADGVRAVDALAEGAFELVPKRASGGKLQDFLDDLLSKIQAAAFERKRAPRRNTNGLELPSAPKPTAKQKVARAKAAAGGGRRLIFIASSTGGPRALTTVVSKLPADVGLGAVIVQHMPAGFTQSLATRLDAYSALNVSEAADGDKIERGRVLVAPGGRHTHIQRHRIELSDEPAIGGLRPCADLTLADAVGEFGPNIVLAVLTGMGRDACSGARMVREAGGVVIAEHGDTTTVNGMPKAVVDAGLADGILPIGEIADAIAEAAGE
ncbi:MAG: chemotaxis-specific protein-glutamate methyltransferase CheB [Solirubrobacterales bacterium]